MRILLLILAFMAPSPLFAQGFAAAKTIPAGTVISQNDLRENNGKIAGITDPKRIIGLEARVTIYEDRPFQERLLQQPKLISRNQIVRLHYERGSLRIIADGRALDDGSAGDLIRVINLDSRTTITARVGEDGTLYVAS